MNKLSILIGIGLLSGKNVFAHGVHVDMIENDYWHYIFHGAPIVFLIFLVLVILKSKI